MANVELVIKNCVDEFRIQSAIDVIAERKVSNADNN